MRPHPSLMHTSCRGICRPRAILIALVAATCVASAARGEDLAERSLPFRKALHSDPTMKVPFNRMLALYQSDGKVGDLVGMYRRHVASYPNDVKALTVLLRLMVATADPGAAKSIADACKAHPENAFLHFLQFRALEKTFDPKALDSLDRAVRLETVPARKREWIEILVPQAVGSGMREIARKQLVELASLLNTAEERLVIAEMMVSHGFDEEAAVLLEKQLAGELSSETMVETELLLARAESHLDRKPAAAARLDRLLSMVTADYWRRTEILRRRAALESTDAGREKLIVAAKNRIAKAQPGSSQHEAAALDLAELFVGCERRRDALDVLLNAGKTCRWPTRLERAALDLMDRLRDTRRKQQFLAERIAADKDRPDLKLLQARTLFMLGRTKEGSAHLDEAIAALPPAEQFTQLLDTARSLRRSMRTEHASKLFERALALDPTRVDVRRELAEIYIALGDKGGATTLLAEGIPEDARTEHLLDVTQFMVSQKMFREARPILERAAEREKTNLEIRTLLLNIERQLGNEVGGAGLVELGRALADTTSRYRLWLESAVAFFTEFEHAESFLGDEVAKLQEENHTWTKATTDRWIAFADVASRCAGAEEVIAIFEDLLKSDMPKDISIKLRSRLVGLMETVAGKEEEAEAHLERLIKDDPKSKTVYRIRLLLLRSKKTRNAANWNNFNSMDIETLDDPVLLAQLEPVLRSRGRTQDAWRILERLIKLDPTNRGNWQRWLSDLVANRNEAKLRGAIRRLVAGIKKMPLAEETRTVLRQHLADSYWRSVGGAFIKGKDDDLSDALMYLDELERSIRGRTIWPDNTTNMLWINWARAHALAGLERTPERAEAVSVVRRIASELEATSAPEPDAEPDVDEAPEFMIPFPDGLTMSMDYAIKCSDEVFSSKRTGLLKSGLDKVRMFTATASKMRVVWAYDALSEIASVTPVGESMILVSDGTGTLDCLDRFTGKLLWTVSDGISPSWMPAGNHGYSHTYGVGFPALGVPVPARDYVLIPGVEGVDCRDAHTGKMLWQVSAFRGVDAASRTMPRPAASVFVRDCDVIVVLPMQGIVAVHDLFTGKLVRDRVLEPSGGHSTWMKAGAALHGDVLLVYGKSTGILDADTLETRWLLQPSRVRKFPVKLHGSSAAATGSAQMTGAVLPSGMGYGRSRYGHHSSGRQGTLYVSHISGGQRHYYYGSNAGASKAYVAPAVAWAAGQNSQSRMGLVSGSKLVLMNDNGVSVLDLTLPLGCVTTHANGVFVGLAGRKVVRLNQSGLATVDIKSGKLRSVSLAQLGITNSNERVQASIDGNRIWITHRGKIACVSALSGHIVSKCEWPEGILPATAAPVTNMHRYFFAQGISTYKGQSYGRCQPLVDVCSDGILYATPGPARLVALIGDDAGVGGDR